MACSAAPVRQAALRRSQELREDLLLSLESLTPEQSAAFLQQILTRAVTTV